jgi:Gpi18-like mannosyltransferase
MVSNDNGWVTPQAFYRLVLIAIALRIFLMPFFGHVDLLSEARRIYFWSESGIYFDDISRNATAIFQLIFFKVFSVFLDHKEAMLFHADMANSTASPSAYFEFVSQPAIFRTIFVIKLPFLCADLISAWALFRFCGKDGGARNAVIFWLFNPITIFAFYIFGRFESIPIMFCILSLLALKNHRLILGALLIGLSINSREIFIFLGPVFIALACSPSCSHFSLTRRAIAVAIVIFAAAVAVQLFSLTGNPVDSFGREVSSIASEGRVDYLFKFIIGSYLMFPMAYFLILLYTWNSNADLRDKSVFVFTMTMVAFFCFSSHTAHYTSWLMIFPCLFLASSSEFLKPMLLLCVTWFFYNLAITDLGVFTTWLMSPLSIHFAGLPNFPQMYQALRLTDVLDLLSYQRLCRTFYTANIIFIAALILRAYVLKSRGAS